MPLAMPLAVAIGQCHCPEVAGWRLAGAAQVRSIYKTYVDIVHVRKIDKAKRMTAEAHDVTSHEEFYAEFEEGNELDAVQQQRVAELRELSQRPDLYDALSQALAPSVWELDDVKRGVLVSTAARPHSNQARAACPHHPVLPCSSSSRPQPCALKVRCVVCRGVNSCSSSAARTSSLMPSRRAARSGAVRSTCC